MGPLTALLVLAATREASIEETSEGQVAPLIETDESTRDVSAEKLFRGVQANTDMLNKLRKLLKANNDLDRKFVLAQLNRRFEDWAQHVSSPILEKKESG